MSLSGQEEQKKEEGNDKENDEYTGEGWLTCRLQERTLTNGRRRGRKDYIQI